MPFKRHMVKHGINHLDSCYPVLTLLPPWYHVTFEFLPLKNDADWGKTRWSQHWKDTHHFWSLAAVRRPIHNPCHLLGVSSFIQVPRLPICQSAKNVKNHWCQSFSLKWLCTVCFFWFQCTFFVSVCMCMSIFFFGFPWRKSVLTSFVQAWEIPRASAFSPSTWLCRAWRPVFEHRLQRASKSYGWD